MFTKLSNAAKDLDVSERFLRQLIKQGRIPFYQLSPRTHRVDLSELRDYMKLLAEGQPGDKNEQGRDASR